ncbi:MAG: cyclic nucleotide-binding protein [Spirochaetae bacterium HGW-Spirochaetae-3]|jgi:hemerythrin|nr:MAG: cyclic nucleotide-binding protein [Spirochaetae bacterium HGW-Spirochaetae-3]
MTIQRVGDGISIADIPEAGLSILCGCPENAVKFLIKSGAIRGRSVKGFSYETGPNAILLSEISVQSGRFSNLAEFPVLQMLYRQGLIIPGHPNNTGVRPMLIGLREQVEAQARYIYAGNYGITSPDALDPDDAAAAASLIRMKKKFSFGAFKSVEELLDVKVIDGAIIELRGGAFIRRLGVNRYEFICDGRAVEADLNLGPGERYGAPYVLPRSTTPRDLFSVVHIGEGDGWDPERPCMSSVVVHEGRPYLVDAGPNIEESLDAVGLRVGDLAGVFHTHVHDDHFVGLTDLMRADRSLAYYAVPMVRRSAIEKLRALCDVGEAEFARFFDVRDLEAGRWNDVDGLGVMPVFSPHPLETTVFRFRAYGPDGPRTYAHYADLSSFAVIDSMVAADDSEAGISAAEAARAKAAYLEPADLKKVDVGGGMIHGDPEDFRNDASTDLLLSHGGPVDIRALGFGRVAAFGEVSVLVPGAGEWSAARNALAEYFPGAPDGDIASLAASPRRSFAEGETVATAGSEAGFAFLTLDGSLERLDGGGAPTLCLDYGALVGAAEIAAGIPHAVTYRASQETEAVAVPAAAFSAFLRRNGLADGLIAAFTALDGLILSPVLAGMRSMPCLYELAASSRLIESSDGAELDGAGVYVLASGRVAVRYGDVAIEEIGPGGVYGEESLADVPGRLFSAACAGPVAVRLIPPAAIDGKPSLLWSLRELFSRRLAIARASLEFRWRTEYALGEPTIDAQHRRIFDAINEAVNGPAEGFDGRFSLLVGLIEEHFATEEDMQSAVGYPGLREHSREHRLLVAELDEFADRVHSGHRAVEIVDYMKDCFIRHTLLEDRKYLPWMGCCPPPGR